MAVKARESQQIQRLRRKIKEQIHDEHKQINQKALEQMRKAMKRWIGRHSEERISLLNKTITLFDENKHTERPHDKQISALMKQIQKGLSLSMK